MSKLKEEIEKIDCSEYIKDVVMSYTETDSCFNNKIIDLFNYIKDNSIEYYLICESDISKFECNCIGKNIFHIDIPQDSPTKIKNNILKTIKKSNIIQNIDNFERNYTTYKSFMTIGYNLASSIGDLKNYNKEGKETEFYIGFYNYNLRAFILFKDTYTVITREKEEESFEEFAEQKIREEKMQKIINRSKSRWF